MNNLLFSRALGAIGPHSLSKAYNDHLLCSLQPNINVKFTYVRDEEVPIGSHDESRALPHAAHPAGVNAITIDKFEGRYLLSGGADASIAVWDLHQAIPKNSRPLIHQPLGYASRDSTSHAAGITHLAFYPFDSLAFLSSSYDHALRLYSSETLTSTASFDLASTIHSFGLSPVASHLLVACATEHPAVRLIDLKSGANAHSLPGHGGGVLSVAWHPCIPHLLLSASVDGAVRTWDIRRSASALGSLDREDSLGIISLARLGNVALAQRRQGRGKAHAGPANGVLWTDDGDYIISAGHDGAVRLWDARTGANTLVNYGPALRNGYSSTLVPLISPGQMTSKSREVMIYPNPRELLVFELHTGRMLSRLRTAGYADKSTKVGAGKGVRNVVNRTTGLAWRPHDFEIYSGHTDGTIRCWKPWLEQDALSDDSDDEGAAKGSERKRKREDLDTMVAGLTRANVGFT